MPIHLSFAFLYISMFTYLYFKKLISRSNTYIFWILLLSGMDYKYRLTLNLIFKSLNSIFSWTGVLNRVHVFNLFLLNWCWEIFPCTGFWGYSSVPKCMSFTLRVVISLGWGWFVVWGRHCASHLAFPLAHSLLTIFTLFPGPGSRPAMPTEVWGILLR